MDRARGRVNSTRPGDAGPGPADPRALAGAIVQEAGSTGRLLVFAAAQAALSSRAPDRRLNGLPLLVRGVLVALVGTPGTRVVIISGHSACDLETQVNVPGVIYAGCRGLQIRGAGMSFCHPLAETLSDMLPALAQELSHALAPFSGVEAEIKELGVTVHVRRADPPTIASIIARVEELRRTAAVPFQVWPFESAVDLVPDVNWGKGSCVLWILEQWMREGHGKPTILYLGDDDSDEDAYLALRGSGHAVHVGQPHSESAASCWVADQAAAIDLLARIAFGWNQRSADR